MPDQSSAATEHAILQEITAPLETLPDDAVAAVHADFPSRCAGTTAWRSTPTSSRPVSWSPSCRRRGRPRRRSAGRWSGSASRSPGILQRAHETAEEITAQSRREGEDRLEHARIEAAEIVAAAHQRVKDLDADTDRIWVERHRIVDDARELAQQLMALAESAAERFPAVEEAPDAAEGGRGRARAAGPSPSRWPTPEPQATPEPHEPRPSRSDAPTTTPSR